MALRGREKEKGEGEKVEKSHVMIFILRYLQHKKGL